MQERVVLEIQGHVAIVTLNRPDKKNAVDIAMFEALAGTAASIAANSSLRAVVLRGAGGNFSAGIDIAAFQDGDVAGKGRMLPLDGTPANFFQNAAYVWASLPIPVIAALEGYVFGAGLQIAAGADIRYATAETRLSVMEIKWGLIPDMALSATLRHVMPLDRVRGLAYSGKIVGGDEALQLGLVTALKVDPFSSAVEFANDVSGRSPDAIRSLKSLTSAGWSLPAADALRMEADLQTRLMGSANQQEAVAANFARRKPQFRDADS
jgi:enoyl-CoA hydratase/carnithine racemase